MIQIESNKNRLSLRTFSKWGKLNTFIKTCIEYNEDLYQKKGKE
jgi:hypothetical protein